MTSIAERIEIPWQNPRGHSDLSYRKLAESIVAESRSCAPGAEAPGGWCDDGRCHAWIDNDFNPCERDLHCCSGNRSVETGRCLLLG